MCDSLTLTAMHLAGNESMHWSDISLYVGHRVMVAHDLQADDEKVQKRVAKKLARQQVWTVIRSHNLE